MYLFTKLYHRTVNHYQIIDKKIENKFSCLRLLVVVYKLVIHVLSCT